MVRLIVALYSVIRAKLTMIIPLCKEVFQPSFQLYIKTWQNIRLYQHNRVAPYNKHLTTQLKWWNRYILGREFWIFFPIFIPHKNTPATNTTWQTAAALVFCRITEHLWRWLTLRNNWYIKSQIVDITQWFVTVWFSVVAKPTTYNIIQHIVHCSPQ